MVRKLTALFSNVNSDWEDGDNYGHSPGRLIYNGKSKTVDECFNYCSSFCDEIGELVGTPVNCHYVSLWLDRDGYELRQHYDLGDVTFGLQIYLEGPNFDPSLGLGFYKPADYDNQGRLIIDRNHEQPIVQLGYRHNCGYLADTSYTVCHGLPKPVTGSSERWSIYVRYF